MNKVTLEQYRCRKYGRLFYINASQRHPLDIDFGCPHGCDDNGRYVGAVRAEVTSTREVN